MFILSIYGRNQMYSSTDEWMKKTHTMKYYSHIKKEVCYIEDTWKDLSLSQMKCKLER